MRWHQRWAWVVLTIPLLACPSGTDHATGTLFAATGDALYQIEPATGASTWIGDLGGVRINDLAFHPVCP